MQVKIKWPSVLILNGTSPKGNGVAGDDMVHAADVQDCDGDCDGGGSLTVRLVRLYPFPPWPFTDGGEKGEIFQNGLKAAPKHLKPGIIKCCEQPMGLLFLHECWFLAGTSVLLNCCHLVKIRDSLSFQALTPLNLASIRPASNYL